MTNTRNVPGVWKFCNEPNTSSTPFRSTRKPLGSTDASLPPLLQLVVNLGDESLI